MHLRFFFAGAFVLFFSLQTIAQTPGIIIKPANAPGKAILDPDGDGYISKKTPPVTGVQIGFSINDISESEIPYAPIVKPDPQGDPLVGPSCSYNEIVGTDAAGNNAVMSYFDGTNMLFRFRLANYAPNSKSYSLLIDTDQKFGFTGVNADPNAVAGNPGFEVEVVLETNFGVEVYKVDGTTTPVLSTPFSTNPYSTNCQKAVAQTTACSDPDYFYDFYIPFSQLTSIAGLGINANTPLRLVAVTSMNPQPAIGNNAISDVGGVTAGNNLDAIYSNLIDASTPTSINNLNNSGILDRSACPAINAVGTSNTAISGTSSETWGSVNVYVYQSNGTTLIGSGSTSISEGTWSINISSLSPSVTLASGQIVKATVTATGKGTSYDNCNPVLVSDCSSQTSIPTDAEIDRIAGGKGYNVIITRPIGTKVYLYTSNYTLRAVADLKNGVTNPFTTTTNPQTISFECQTGNCFGTDVYYFRFQEPGKCISPYYVSCDYATGGTSAFPTISTSTITTSSSSISGNGTVGNAQIYIYAGGNQIASTTTAATSPYAWTATVSSLSLCQVITARQIISGQCLSDPSSGVTVTRQAVKPVINFTGCSASSPVTSLSGYSSEADGTTITLYTPNSSGTSLGSTTVTGGIWTKSGLNLTSGTVVAKVTAGNCLTASADSNPITISNQTNIASYTIGITTPTEGQISLSGTISGGTYPLTLKVYVDEALVGSGITVNSAGNWTVSGLNSFDLALGSKVQVKITSGTGCESSLSSTYAIVQCVLPQDKTLSAPTTVYCANSYGAITVQNSELGVIYTPILEDGTVFGYGAIGTGADLNLTTSLLTGNLVITIKVKATKFPIGSCSRNLTGSIALTVNPLPAVPTASANQTYCGSGVTTLANLLVTPPVESNVIWYNTATGGSSILSGTTLVSGTTYYAESQNSITNCSSISRTAITVQSGTPAAPTANASQSFCTGATISNLEASLSGPGTLKWYTAASGGTLKNAGDALVTGTTYYAETSQNSCVSSSRSPVTVTLFSSTSISGQSTAAQTQCIGGSFNPISVTASGADLTYQWYSNSSASTTGGSVIGGANSSSYVPSASVSGNLYYYCIVNGSCGSSVTSDVSGVFIVSPLSTGGIVSGPETVCASVNTTPITLSGYTGSIIKWQSSPAFDFSSSVTDISNTTALLTATNLSSTTYYRALVQSGVCTSQYSATATIVVNPLPSTPAIGTITQPTCGLPKGSVELSNLPAVGNWTITPSSGTPVSGTGTSHTFSGLSPSAIYTFTVTDELNCTSSPSSNAVINDVSTPPSTPVVTGTTQPTCGTPSGTIVINTQTNVQYSVGFGYQASGTFSGLAPGTYTISVRNTADNSCVTNAASTVTINAVPSAPSIPSAASVVQPTCGAPSGSITFNTQTGVQYSVGGAYQGSEIFTGLTPGNYTLYVRKNSDNTCISSSLTTETINTVPPAPSAPVADGSQSFCNGISPKVWDIVITGTNITWYDANSGTNIVAPNTALVNNTTYYATQSSSGCESTRTAVTVAVLACTGPDIEDNTVNINENLANGSQVYNINDHGTGNDNDIDGKPLSYSIIDGNSSGAFTIDPSTGIITVNDVSQLNYETITSFSIIVEATNGSITNNAVITINLNNLNDNNPVAVADNFTVNEGATFSVPAPGVLDNDYDTDGNTITSIKVSDPAHGTLTLNADGSFSYTHDGGESTSDAFTYKVSDGTYNSNTVTINISINPVNDKPVVNDFSASVNEDNTLGFAAVDFTSSYTDADGNALTKIIIISLPDNGTLKLSGVNISINSEILLANISNLTFVPSNNWNGNTSFSWNGFDGTIYALADATVQITVNAVNDAPTLSNMTKSVNEDNTLSFSVADFTNEFLDPDGNAISKIKIASLPVNGTLKLLGVNVSINDEINAADVGNLTYTPDANWSGNNSFEWNGYDGSTYASSTANVDITVNPQNDAPVIGNIAKSLNEDNVLSFAAFDFSNAFSDIDGNSLSRIKITSLPANGTLMLSGISVNINDEVPVANLGNLVFEPGADWTGNTSFSWNGFDGTIYASSDKNVSISVNGVNDLPLLSSINVSNNEDNVLLFSSTIFTTAFSDIDGNSLERIKIGSLPTNGKLLLSGVEVEINDEIAATSLDNLVFAPNADWNGTTNFKWNGFDGSAYAISDADVNITVNAVNDAPEVSNIYKSVLSSATLTFSATDFNNAYTDIENNALNSIKVISLPAVGTLKLSGTPVAAGDIISAANLSDFTFEPSGVGSASFAWNATDGTFYSAFEASVEITISATPNTLPIVSDFAETINEDETLTFAIADFTGAYSDVSAMAKVKITSLPANATLKLSGFNVEVNDEISTNDLLNLTLTPNLNWNGNTSFGWNGFDGADYAASNASVNITVNPLNDAPEVSNVPKNANEDNIISFSLTDFSTAYVDAEAVSLVKIKITSLPANGTLKLSGVNVTIGQEINATDIDNLTLLPSNNWNGNTSFTWNASDGTSYAASDANVNITINAATDAPVLSDVAVSVNEDNTLTFASFDFTGAFTDIDGNALSVIKITSLPANGTLKLSGVDIGVNDEISIADAGNLTFVPAANWNGSTSFGWNGYDGTTYASLGAFVNILVNTANDAPTVNDISTAGNEDNSLAFSTVNFTNAYFDLDGDPLIKIKIISLPVNGTLKLSGTTLGINDEITAIDLENLTFTPDANWSGNNSFAWNAYDGNAYASSDAYVYITINSANDAPVVSSFSKPLNEDNILTFAVSDFTGAFADNDGNTLQNVKITSLPANGTLKLSGINVIGNDEILVSDLINLTFEPDLNWNGSTSFGWNGSEGTAYALLSANVNLTVNAVNDLPLVSDIYKSALTNVVITFAAADFIGAYSDIENEALSRIRIETLPLNGTLKLSGVAISASDEIDAANLGNITFEPTAGWNGNTSFSWKAFDGNAYSSSSADVNITISATPNVPPVVSDIAKSVNEDQILSFTAADFSGAYSDGNNDPVVGIKITSLPANATLQLLGVDVSVNDEIPIASVNNLKLIPDEDWSGSTSFAWTALDGIAYASSDANLNITVNALNDGPLLSDISKNWSEDNTLTFASSDFTNAFTDIDGNSLTKIKITGLPANGTLKLSGIDVTLNQEINVADLDNLTFVPDNNWNGSTSFSWTGYDGITYASSDAAVNISVSSSNDAPSLSDISKSTNEDNLLSFSEADFKGAFTDIDGDLLVKIRINSLPVHGALKLSGIIVNVGDEILINNIDNLTFTPEENWNGTTSFSWNGSDGTVYSSSDASADLTVNAVNDIPVVSNIYKSALTNTTVSFSGSDFTSTYNDIDNNPLTKIRIETLPLNGTLNISGVPISSNDEIIVADLGNLTFVPNNGWNGLTSFIWNASDGFTYSSGGANVEIIISAVSNTRPVISNVAVSADEDNTLTFNSVDFSNAFSDSDNDAMVRIQITSLPANGTLKLSVMDVTIYQEIVVANISNLVFVPDGDWNGNTSFSWNGFDGKVYAAADADVNILINAVNDLPALTNIGQSTNEDNTFDFTSSDFTSAFSDADGGSLSKIKITGLPANGTLQLSGVPVAINQEITLADLSNLSFVPNTNWNGTTNFIWNASDGTDYASSGSMVTITVNPVNDAPVLSAVSKNVHTNTAANFTASDFSNAFTDPDNTLVKIKIIGLPSNGILKLAGVNVNVGDEINTADLANLTFEPTNGWNGSTSFVWNGSDGTAYATNTANVNITVASTFNILPVISSFPKQGDEDKSLQFTATDFTSSFTDADGNTLINVKITSMPLHGKLQLNGVDVNVNQEIAYNSLANLTFVPDTNWNGTTSFGWNGMDSEEYAAVGANVDITINAVNDAPFVKSSPLLKTTNEDSGPYSFDITGNITEAEGEAIAFSIIGEPKHGTVTNDNTGNITYTPGNNYNGNDTITYRTCDNATPSLCSAGIIVITVTAVNDQPELSNAAIVQTIPGNSAKTIDILPNVINVDGDVLTVSIFDSPANGTVTVNSAGEIMYIPNTSFAGRDTIVYKICDSGNPSLCTTGTIIITVTSVEKPNHAPVIENITQTTAQDVALLLDRNSFKSKFTDEDNDTLVLVRIVSLPANGVLMLNDIALTRGEEISWNDLNKLKFVPETGYFGEVSFSWEASDGKEYSLSADVIITVTEQEIFIPEGFSPNGDGINDFFIIKGAEQFEVTLRIFNRWGNLVYETKRYQNDWEGKSNAGLLIGTELPDGTYFYTVNFNNGEKEKIGYITVNR